MNELGTIQYDFRTPMMKYLFRNQEKHRNKNYIALAGIRVQFQRNPAWGRCYGGR